MTELPLCPSGPREGRLAFCTQGRHCSPGGRVLAGKGLLPLSPSPLPCWEGRLRATGDGRVASQGRHQGQVRQVADLTPSSSVAGVRLTVYRGSCLQHLSFEQCLAWSFPLQGTPRLSLSGPGPPSGQGCAHSHTSAGRLCAQGTQGLG